MRNPALTLRLAVPLPLRGEGKNTRASASADAVLHFAPAEAGGGARMERVRRPAGVASRRRTRAIRAPTDRSSRPRPRELLIALPSACASRDHRDDCGLSSRHPAAPIGFQPDPGYRRFSSCRGFRFGVQEGPGLPGAAVCDPRRPDHAGPRPPTMKTGAPGPSLGRYGMRLVLAYIPVNGLLSSMRVYGS